MGINPYQSHATTQRLYERAKAQQRQEEAKRIASELEELANEKSTQAQSTNETPKSLEEGLKVEVNWVMVNGKMTPIPKK